MNNKETRTLENSNKHIDNWLSQQFQDFSPNPDPALWQSIDSALDRKERRSKFIWYWLAAGVLLIVVAGVGLQFKSKQNNILYHPVAHTAKSIPAEEKSATTSSVEKNSNIPLTRSNEGVVNPIAENHSASDKNALLSDVTSSTHIKSSKNNASQKNSASLPNIAVRKNSNQSYDERFLNNAFSSPGTDRNVVDNRNDGVISGIQNNLRPLTEPTNTESDFSLLKSFGLQFYPNQIERISDDLRAAEIFLTNKVPLPLNIMAKNSAMLGRWSVEFGADANQTGLTYRAKNEFKNYVHKNFYNRMEAGEFALSASRVQAAFMYQLSQKHAFKLGLAYAENRTQQIFNFQDSMPATVVQGQKADALGYYPIFGYLGLGPQVNFESKSTYTMLSIPLGYTGHYPWRNGLCITPEILLSANRLGVSSGAQTLDYQTLLQKNQSDEQFRTWLLGARIAIGIEKRLNYVHSIGLRLNAQSMISPMYVPNAALESRGWSTGLSVHYSWRIN